MRRGIGSKGPGRTFMEYIDDVPNEQDLSSIHVPVMLERTLELLGPALDRPGALLVDATLG